MAPELGEKFAGCVGLRKIGIIEHKDFSAAAVDKLSTLGSIMFFNSVEDDLRTFVRDKEILFVRLGYLFDKKTLLAAENLQFICSPTTGLNHIDVDQASKQGIAVISLKGETEFLRQITATSEHTLGLIFSLLRNYKAILNITSEDEADREFFKGYELNSSSIGIIGMGRIGTHLSRYLYALGSRVFFYDNNPPGKERVCSQV